MANKARFEIIGNQFVVTDTTTGIRNIQVARDEVTPFSYVANSNDFFTFFNKSPRVNGFDAEKLNKLGVRCDPIDSTKTIGQTDYQFVDIVDLNDVAFSSAEVLDLWLNTNLGSLVPAILPTPASGLESFFLTAKGAFGTGGGWSDSGFIGDVPVLFFDRTSVEKQITTFFAMSRILLTTDPILTFLTYSVALPVVTTSDQVVWQVQARYIGVGEDATKAVDETLQITQTLDQIAVDRRQTNLTFTLDGSLISDQDSIQITFSRLANHVDDNYNSDIAVGQAGITVEVTQFSP